MRIDEMDRVMVLSIVLLVVDVVFFILNNYVFHMVPTIPAILILVAIAGYSITTFIIAKINDNTFTTMIELLGDSALLVLHVRFLVKTYVESDEGFNKITDEYTKSFFNRLRTEYTIEELNDSLDRSEANIKKVLKSLKRAKTVHDGVENFDSLIDNILHVNDGLDIISQFTQREDPDTNKLIITIESGIDNDDVYNWLSKAIEEV